MKDQRLYGKFTLDFAENFKILPLSDTAFRALVEMTLWSRKQETDGFLASRLAVAKWGLSTLEELCSNDPENPSLYEVPNGYQIHDYALHQDTKAEIDARRERNKINGQKGGIAKGKRVAKPAASESPTESPSQRVAEEEEEEEKYKNSFAHPDLSTHLSNARPARKTGSEVALARLSKLPTASVPAREIVHAYNRSLAQPLTAKIVGEMSVVIDECLDAHISPEAIAAGIKEWTRSDSWAPSQIPKFVHKAANRHTQRTNGVGKPTEKALGYEDIAQQIIAELETTA